MLSLSHQLLFFFKQGGRFRSETKSFHNTYNTNRLLILPYVSDVVFPLKMMSHLGLEDDVTKDLAFIIMNNWSNRVESDTEDTDMIS